MGCRLQDRFCESGVSVGGKSEKGAVDFVRVYTRYIKKPRDRGVFSHRSPGAAPKCFGADPMALFQSGSISRQVSCRKIDAEVRQRVEYHPTPVERVVELIT